MTTTSKITSVLMEIPLEQIMSDLPQPRDKENTKIDDEENRLLLSLKEEGLGSAITVTKIENNKYKIINGHRRYACAKILGWQKIRCEVISQEDALELERLRFNLQTNISQWRPIERSNELKRIKSIKKFKSNKALASYLHYPEPLLSTSLTLQKKLDKYRELVDEFEKTENYTVSRAYQEEFVRLYPKIRQIKEFTPEDISRNILKRVKHEIITSAKDLRKLGSVFLRSQTNEKEIHEWLKNMDMKVQPLYENTARSGFLRDIENIDKQIDEKKNNISDPEDDGLRKLFKKLKVRYEP